MLNPRVSQQVPPLALSPRAVSRLLFLYIVCFLPLSSVWAQSSSLLRNDYPTSYTVQEGDSLWEIASQFMVDPDRWQEIWKPDRYLDDPDLIFPGDILTVNFVGGSPRIMVKRGSQDVERLSPTMREQSLTSAIPAIPLESIENSFTQNRIVTQELYDAAPYIVQNLGDNLAIATGDEIFARGTWPERTTSFEVYRPSREYFDDSGDELLGLEVEYLGFATIVSSHEDNVRRLLINNSSKEIRVSDRLLVREQTSLGATIFPTEPSHPVEARIISVLNGEAMGSQLDTVVINIGSEEDLEIGHVLAVRTEDSNVVDVVERSRMTFQERMRNIFSNNQARVALPGDDIGTLLVYKVFAGFSYAVILSSPRPIELNFRVTNP